MPHRGRSNAARAVMTALAMTCAAGALPASAQQTAIRDYNEASDVFWGGLYPDGFTELYCGATIAQRGAHNIEHVFPAFWMTKAFECGSRQQCRRNNLAFNRMEGDLHNLYPTRIEVNSRRGSLPFGEIAGEDHDFPGCDFEENAGLVEPRTSARGEVARSVLYMVEAYDAADAIPQGQLDLMRDWDRLDPPDAAERARNDRIAELQGVRNRFIDAHPVTPGGDPGGLGTVVDEPPPGVRVRIATWNIANLHAETGQHLPGRPDAAARSDADYARIARYIAGLEADIVAFQEVNGPPAARRVFPEDKWEIVVSDRYDEDLTTGRETDHIYTGVAVRRDGAAAFIAGQTYDALSVDHTEGGVTRPTRRGTEVLVELPNGEPLQIMSVHLKSGCHQGRLDAPTAPACETLSRQRAPLEAWIDALTEEGTPFVIAGDWNRRIDIHGAQDHLWGEIDDGDPAPLDLFRFPENMTSPCLFRTPDHRPRPIDFIVLDEQAARWVDVSSAAIVDFREEDKPARRQISDHCPVTLDLFVPVRPEG